jgi:uncharacterized protein with HEPN domain
MLHRMQCDIVQTCGRNIRALLAEMQEEQELFDSPSTLHTVEAELLTMAQTLEHMSPLLRERLTHLDWHGWHHLQQVLTLNEQPRRETVWYGIQALVPATLELLAQLRRQEPVWFELGY